jgi:hypothetical protein
VATLGLILGYERAAVPCWSRADNCWIAALRAAIVGQALAAGLFARDNPHSRPAGRRRREGGRALFCGGASVSPPVGQQPLQSLVCPANLLAIGTGGVSSPRATIPFEWPAGGLVV